MAKQLINLGTAPAGSDGDTARTANVKINDMFGEHYTLDGTKTTAQVAQEAANAAQTGATDALAAAAAAQADIDAFSSHSQTFRNKVMNGNFYEIQRYVIGQTLVNPLAIYMCDRWQDFNSGSSLTCSQQPFAIGQTAVPGALYFHRSVVASVANIANSVRLFHYVEDVSTFASQRVTLSWYARADAPRPMAAEVRQLFGTGGAVVNIVIAQQVALTTGWQRFTITFDVPTISGKAVGVGNALLICFWFDSGANFNANSANLGQQSGTFDVANVQLEAGEVATEFELLPTAINKILCARYYEAGRMQQDFYSGAGVYGTNTVDFKVEKRIAPAIAATYNYALNTSGGLTDNINTKTFRAGAAAGSTGAAAYVLTWAAGAEF
jgi:hypothetical protein